MTTLQMQNLLTYWFSPETAKKWFNSSPETDAEIIEKFGYLVTEYEARTSSLPHIIICDQLTRHYDRVHGTSTSQLHGDHAVEMSLELIQSSEFEKCTPEQRCFILLPLRHSKQLNLIKISHNKIMELMEEHEHIPSIYIRFYKASFQCLSEIIKPTYYPPTPVAFPSRKGLLDSKCAYNTGKAVACIPSVVPMKWKESFLDTISLDTDVVVISLSGGGDSMTACYILKALGYNVIALMVDYNNRDSCKDEVQMVRKWAYDLGIDLYVLHNDSLVRSRRSSLREIYERYTRIMRFNAYKYVARQNGQKETHVVLGHNLDDSKENIIGNLCQRCHFTNLKVIKSKHCEDGVWIYRPLRDISKCDITQFADQNNIPYLYDSTPKWSCRGRIRDELAPVLTKFDPRLMQGLCEMADYTQQVCASYYKLLERVTTFTKKTIPLQVSKGKPIRDIPIVQVDFMEENYEESYWLFIFEKLLNSYQCPMVGIKGIRHILAELKVLNSSPSPSPNPKYLVMCAVKNMRVRIYSNKMYVIRV